eukprot:166214-Pelagomonas_calceolata.AAC.3
MCVGVISTTEQTSWEHEQEMHEVNGSKILKLFGLCSFFAALTEILPLALEELGILDGEPGKVF